ncbi:PLDc N-terminal domain-containing protein [Myroides pelagicus]|uniref:PLDc N-terminal domain-containing protein n=1 Tax=Myroides pelagicus TaxID=270914 RepID=UPI00398ADA4C
MLNLLFFWQFFLLCIPLAYLFLLIYCIFRLRKTSLNNEQKISWIFLIVLIPFFGAFSFLIIEKTDVV